MITLLRNLALVVPTCVALAGAPAHAAVEHGTVDGIRYAMGGVGLGERDAMHAERRDYTLWVATAARGSGVYLADVDLRITDARDGRPVVQATMSGPWLFVDLPPGRYVVHATAPGGQRLTQRVDVRDNAMRQVMLRFDVPADADAERAHRFGAAGRPAA